MSGHQEEYAQDYTLQELLVVAAAREVKDNEVVFVGKDESVSPAGSHKPNTTVPQAYFNKVEGIERLTTETGAGQWERALLRHRTLRSGVQGLHGPRLV